MGFLNRYKMHKRGLQILLFINAILICLGVVAGVRYFQDHDISSLELFLVGFFVLGFGVVLPGFFLYRAEQKLQKMRQQMYTHLSSLVAIWAETYKEHEGEIYKNPMFWANMLLLAVEEVGPSVDHPLMHMFLEFAPYVRKEIKKSSKHSHAGHGSKKLS